MSDPFGRGDRTIIVPDPGGRRRAAPPPAVVPQPAPPPVPLPSAPAYPVPPGAALRPAVPGTRGEDDWASPDVSHAPAASAPATLPGERQRALVMKRDVVVAPNANPYLKAAGPLLLLLGRLRVQLSRASFANLMEQVAASIDEFETDTHAAGAPAAQIRTAKYVVCATADDIVQNIPTDERHIWTQYSMLSRFFGERVGGVKFFEELERAKVDPSGNYHLLELFHACLAVGFAGVHRTSSGGAAALQQIQRNLYELLRRTRAADREISPRWAGQTIPTEAFRFKTPLWAVGAVVAALLLGLYVVLRLLLSGSAEASAEALVAVHPTSEVGIQRRLYRPPPPPPPPPPQSQPGSFQAALAGDIANGSLVLADNANQLVLRVAAALFAPGDAAVKPEFNALLGRIAGLIDKEPGAIKVVGHTDSSPIRTVRFPSNFQLSQERARAVATILKGGLSKPDRVEVEGKGADVPIAPNGTVEGRAKNRRVEIVVPRTR